MSFDRRRWRIAMRRSPILDTARDTLAWLPSVHEDKRRRFSSTGIGREKEAKVLAAWKARE